MKVVLDANVYVSALIAARGHPSRIMQRWEKGEFEVIVTQEIIDEVGRVLRYPRISRRHQASETKIRRYLKLLARQATIVEVEEPLTVVTADETDNRYIECAVTAQADYIVSGDQHLLEVGQYRGIVILSPAAFITLLEAEI